MLSMMLVMVVMASLLQMSCHLLHVAIVALEQPNALEYSVLLLWLESDRRC